MKKMKIIPKNKNKIYSLLKIFLNSFVEEQDIHNILSHLEFEGDFVPENIDFHYKIQDFEDMKTLYEILPFFSKDKEKLLTVIFSYLYFHYNHKINLLPVSLAKKEQSIKVNSIYVRFYKLI